MPGRYIDKGFVGGSLWRQMTTGSCASIEDSPHALTNALVDHLLNAVLEHIRTR